MSELDEELAAATDALLGEHNTIRLSDGNHEFEQILRQLYFTVAPDKPPSTEFDKRLTARLNSEWDRMYARPALRLLDQPLSRVMTIAAAVVLALVAIITAVPAASREINGAAPDLSVVIAAASLTLFAACVFVIFRHRR